MKKLQIFLSHSSEDAFEANLLQLYLEYMLKDFNVKVWSYVRDQSKHQKQIGESIRKRVKESVVVIMLISQFTFESGATQWMELAYADAFNKPTFILLHHITFDMLRGKSGVPPLVIEGQCTPAIEWLSIVADLQKCFEKKL